MKLPCSEIYYDASLNTSRELFTVESCMTLADSIHQNGQDTAVKVTEGGPDGFKYTLRVGFRRFNAISFILKQESIEADVVEFENESDAALANLRENLERQDLTYFEECKALHRLFDSSCSINGISERVSRSRHWVSCRWKVWDLEPEIILGIETGDFGPSDIALMLGRTREEQIERAEAIRTGKAQGETRDEIAAKLGRKQTRPNKLQIGKMLTIMDRNNKDDAKYALLWANGDIDNEAFLNYTRCSETQTG